MVENIHGVENVKFQTIWQGRMKKHKFSIKS